MVSQLYTEIERISGEIRRLRGRLDRISIGGQIIPSTTTPISQGGGGTGIIGSPLGVTVWQNDTGIQQTKGSVVVWKTARLFDLPSVAADTKVIGVLDGSSINDSDNVPNGGNGRVRHVGYQSRVFINGTVDVGDFLVADGGDTQGAAVSAGPDPVDGAFGIALTDSAASATEVQAYVFPVLHVTAGGGGAATSVVEEDFTTDELEKNLYEWNVPEDDKVFQVEVRGIARRTGGAAGSDGDSAYYIIEFAIITLAGVPQFVGGSYTMLLEQEDQPAWDLQILLTGAGYTVSAFGEVDNDINWWLEMITREGF